MTLKKKIKILGFGIVNFAFRFVVGGIMYMGFKMNPEGLAFGIIITAAALLSSFVLLRYVMKPQSIKEAYAIAGVWVLIILALDLLTVQPIIQIPFSFLYSQPQAWTRLLVIFLATPFVYKK